MGHTPGRGHRRKSDPHKKRRFRQKALSKKVQAEERHQRAIERWELMTDEQKKFRPEFHPDNFVP